jgi:GNAT superfamily N-acetyltransferase
LWLGDKKVRVRQATLADIPALVALRMALFVELGEALGGQEEALHQASVDYFSRAMAEGRLISWVAEDEEAAGGLLAVGSLTLFERPPYPGNLAGREACLLNMYTRPAWRKRGLASQLLDAMTAYADQRGFGKLWLHASDTGRPIYERAGFVGHPGYLEREPG